MTSFLSFSFSFWNQAFLFLFCFKTRKIWLAFEVVCWSFYACRQITRQLRHKICNRRKQSLFYFWQIKFVPNYWEMQNFPIPVFSLNLTHKKMVTECYYKVRLICSETKLGLSATVFQHIENYFKSLSDLRILLRGSD